MNDDGRLNNASSNGNYWSSSPYASGHNNAGHMNFNNSGGVNPKNNNNRANAFSVRCVSVFGSKRTINQNREICYNRECGQGY